MTENMTPVTPEAPAAAATAIAIVPEFEEALKSISVEIDDRQDPEQVEKERKKIYEAVRDVEKVDIRETADVFGFGAEIQSDLSHFSDTALANVKTKDLGEIGDMIGRLVVELKGFTTEDDKKKGLFGFLKKGASRIELLKTRYEDATTSVDSIVNALNSHKIQLLKDIVLLEELYNENLVYLKTLTVYIALGKKKLEEFRNGPVAEAVALAERTGLPEDAQAAKDLNDKAERFEKKIYDLELTRTIAVQMAPQIRLIQSSDTVMVEKIQSTIANTIPVWKSQMVMALGLEHSQQAMQAQQAVTDLTNELLRKNAEQLHMATTETAKAAERGIIDIETLTYTNQQLIDTMDEVMRIQAEGRDKRRAAEEQLRSIEDELKKKMLEFKNN